MGENMRLELDVGRTTLFVEEGFGAKQPDPNPYNTGKFTLLAHAHAGLKWNRVVDVGFHAMHAWAREEDRDNSGTNNFCISQYGCEDANGNPFTRAQLPVYDVGLSGFPDGSLTIVGAEIAIRNTVAGEFYLGYSHVGATNAWVVDDVVEPIHSGGGGEFKQGIVGNYLEHNPTQNPTPTALAGVDSTSGGTGRVDTMLLQYDFSLANLMSHLANKGQFWGDGPDLTLSYFMMYNSVFSKDVNLGATGSNGSESKIKYGFDLLGTPLKWLGLGLRFDELNPNNWNGNQSFMILSPRLVFKTAFVTHEQIGLQYSRYIYSQRTCATGVTGNGTAVNCVQPPPATVQPNGFGNAGPDDTPIGRGAPTRIPDVNVLNMSATMWW
jgi:hypothetical protein